MLPLLVLTACLESVSRNDNSLGTCRVDFVYISALLGRNILHRIATDNAHL